MPNTPLVRYTFFVGRKNKKNAYVFKKDDQDWGPFTLKELVEVALDGEMEEDTELHDLANKINIRAGDIDDVSKAIRKYKKRKAREQELKQVEADVVRLEKGSNRRKWGPILIVIAVIAVAGGSAWFILGPRTRDNKFVPRLLFRDVDLVRLSPLSVSGVILNTRKKTHKKARGIHVRRIHLLHHWEAMMDMNFSNNGHGAQGKLTSTTILSMKKRLGWLVSLCAKAEIKRNSGFHDATVGFLLKNSGTAELTSVKSQSGISRVFMQCAKTGSARMHFPPYSGSPKGIVIPITRR